MYFYEPKFIFSSQQLLTMFKLQAEANNVMSDAWKTSCNCTIQYYRASNMEAAEAIEHHSWKWWKKTPADIEQMVIELIDILHFTLSHYMRDSYVAFEADGAVIDDNFDDSVVYEYTAEVIDELDNVVTIMPVGRNYSDDAYEKIALVEGTSFIDIEKYDFIDLMELFQYTCLAEGRPDIVILYALFDKVGITPDAVFDYYINKNLLNKFRTSHGQRTNDYYKLWEGREDNVWLAEFMAERRANGLVTVTDEDFAELNNFLETTYQRMLDAGTVEKK